MRLLFLGDVVGRSGRDAITARLPGLVSDHSFDFVVSLGTLHNLRLYEL